MNWTKFKDPISHMCLVGTVVACWSLIQEVARWQVRVLLMSYIFEKHLGQTALGFIKMELILSEFSKFTIYDISPLFYPMSY